MPSEPKLKNSHGKLVLTCIDHRMMLNNKENIKSRLVVFYLLNAPKYFRYPYEISLSFNIVQNTERLLS